MRKSSVVNIFGKYVGSVFYIITDSVPYITSKVSNVRLGTAVCVNYSLYTN